MPTTSKAIQPPSKKLRVQAYPAFASLDALQDFLARAAWHFSHVHDFELFVPLAPGLGCPDDAKIPTGFAHDVQAALDTYLPRVRFQFDQSPEKTVSLLKHANVVLKWVEGNVEVDKAVNASGKVVYRVDPAKVRQEGSFFIQCALDLFSAKDSAISESSRKFEALTEQIGPRKRAWVLATGPSVESYASHDYSDAVVLVCNSVVLNDDLMRVCKPSILVFADPIFHFGVSQYAGRFREIVRQRLDSTDLTIVVPFKYYPLIISKFPRYAHRIIGVPFEKLPHFNLDIRADFKVKTTANILTLLLLPLAATFAQEIHITGCDGRPLDQNDYFWGHGASVQINDKMENIRKVHPGFFDIDYNEYYFEHCHTLDNLIAQTELEGRRLAHHGKSFIPALRDRTPERLRLPLEVALAQTVEARQGNATACILLEPDGIGTDGHYVGWHNNLIDALRKRFERIDVLCNRAQDPTLYQSSARPTFTSHSWFIARSEQAAKADFSQSKRYRDFVAELKEAIRELHSPLPAELSIFIYYGSVQILKAMQDLRADLLKDGCELRSFVCLFHESVIIDPTRAHPRFPPNAGPILMHAAAQKDAYRVASVTGRLADLIFQKYGVSTEVFTNPPPGLTDAEAKAKIIEISAPPTLEADGRETLILVPSRAREEKGSKLIAEFIHHLGETGVPNGHKYILRGPPPEGLKPIPGVVFLDEQISDEAYRANLNSADILIVPYLAPCFTYRTSGILVDALLSGTPTIVLSGTWLADVINDLGVGLAVRYRGPLTFASAITVLLDNQESVRNRMKAGAMRYLTKNNWRTTAMFAMGRPPESTSLLRNGVAVPALPPGVVAIPRKLTTGPSPRPCVNLAFKRGLVAEFATSPYRIDPAPDTAGDLEKAKAEIIAKIPFRSPIYLPTEKIPMQEQVVGLSRVHSLVQEHNLNVSRQRFNVIKAKLESRGKDRIFVIGNGPSLKRTDLSLLKDEITIGFNGIFLHDSFTPTIYVVEDHLVAEDRKDEIHAYDCFVKVFPSYLAYCIEPQENTLYLNHRPRVSFPVDTDFSADAGNITYTGGTVTYTGLQLAASLGFKQIILIGVDASYQVHDVERSDSYGTGVLTSKADDANHFNPSYFGKGYRWHDPNVNTMLQAYRKARNYGRANGVRVVNATLGGQLEVFPRVDFHDLFPRKQVFPRLGVLDFTSVAQLCATGVVKQNLLAGWPKDATIHASAPREGRVIAFQSVAHDLYAVGSDEKRIWAGFRSLIEFDPEVLYLRPTHDRVVMTTLQLLAAALLGRPWTIHYMDDWLEKTKVALPPDVACAYETIMRRLMCGAARVFSICQKMSDFLIAKYDLPPDRVIVAHNYLPDPPPSPKRARRTDGGPLVIRYSGGLEPDMGLGSLVELAQKIEAYNAGLETKAFRLEIYAPEFARTNRGAEFRGFPSTVLLPQLSAYPDYLEALATSDLNLICYNFDSRSIDYVRYSLANKLPELLSAGVPFLAIGDPDVATMKMLKDAGYPLVADSPDYDLRSIIDFVREPATEPLERYHAAVSTLKEEFSDARNRCAFQQGLRQAAALPTGNLHEPALPLAELILLAETSRPRLLGTRDFDSLVRLLLVDRRIVDQALALTRSHGLTWSIRTEFDLLKAECPDAAELARKDDTIKARALAFLICSLGGDTHNHPVVNNVVREWLLTNYPLPEHPAMNQVREWLTAHNSPRLPATSKLP